MYSASSGWAKRTSALANPIPMSLLDPTVNRETGGGERRRERRGPARAGRRVEGRVPQDVGAGHASRYRSRVGVLRLHGAVAGRPVRGGSAVRGVRGRHPRAVPRPDGPVGRAHRGAVRRSILRLRRRQLVDRGGGGRDRRSHRGPGVRGRPDGRQSAPPLTSSPPFDRHGHAVLRPERDHRLELDTMAGHEVEAPPLGDGGEDEDAFQPGEVLADAHPRPRAERQIRVPRPPGTTYEPAWWSTSARRPMAQAGGRIRIDSVRTISVRRKRGTSATLGSRPPRTSSSSSWSFASTSGCWESRYQVQVRAFEVVSWPAMNSVMA